MTHLIRCDSSRAVADRDAPKKGLTKRCTELAKAFGVADLESR